MKIIKIYIVLIILFSNALNSQITSIDTIYNCNSHIDKDFYIIDFWGTYCKPCINSIPYLNDLYKQNKHRESVAFVSITNENMHVVNKFIDKNPLHGCIGIDSDFSLMHKYNIKLIPKVIIINSTGDLLWKGNPYELNSHIIESVLNEEFVKLDTLGFTSEFRLLKSDTTVSEVTLSTYNYRAIDFIGKQIYSIYHQILKLRENRDVTIRYNSYPKLGFQYDCYCKADTLNFNEYEFYTYCLNSLNAALNVEISGVKDTLFKYQYYISDENKLNKNITDVDSFYYSITDKHIIVNNVGVVSYVESISRLFNIKANTALLDSLNNIGNKKYRFTIKNTGLSGLQKELQKIGLSFKRQRQYYDVYTLEFK